MGLQASTNVIGAVVSVNLSGHEELAKLLAEIPEKHVKPALRKTLRAAAKPILAAVKLRSPRDSGAMRKGFVIRAFKRSRKQRIGFWIGTTERAGAYKDKAFYAYFIEKGWKIGKRSVALKRSMAFVNRVKRSPLKLKDSLGRKIAEELVNNRVLRRKALEARAKSIVNADKRKFVPGKHIVEGAYKEHAEAQKNFIVTELTKVLNAIKKGS